MSKDHYGVDLYGNFTRQDTELLGPLTTTRLKAVLNNLMGYRDSSQRDDYSINQEGLVSDIITNAPVETISMFNLLDSGNHWTSRTAFSVVRHTLAGFSLTSDQGIVAGGENASTLLGTTDRFSDSGNSWTSRTAFSVIRHSLTGFSLTSDQGIE
jgi:hypothetical protein